MSWLDKNSSNPYAMFLRDFCTLLAEMAMDAKLDASGSVGGAQEDFQVGRTAAYYEVVSLVQSLAGEAFGLDRTALGPLAEMDPDEDLL